MAASSLGKLDAICAKLKSSQLTTTTATLVGKNGDGNPGALHSDSLVVTPKVKSRSNEEKEVVGHSEKGHAATTTTTTNGSKNDLNESDDHQKTAEGSGSEMANGRAAVSVSVANGTFEREAVNRNESERQEGVWPSLKETDGKGHGDSIDNADKEAKEDEDCHNVSDSNGITDGLITSSPSKLESNINNNNNSKAQDFNEKAENGASTKSPTKPSQSSAEFVSYNEHSSSSSPSTLSSVDHVSKEDASLNQSSVIDEVVSSSKQVLSNSPSSPSSTLMLPNAQTPSTTSSVVSSLSSSSSFSSIFPSSKCSAPLSSAVNEHELKFDMGETEKGLSPSGQLTMARDGKTCASPKKDPPVSTGDDKECLADESSPEEGSSVDGPSCKDSCNSINDGKGGDNVSSQSSTATETGTGNRSTTVYVLAQKDIKENPLSSPLRSVDGLTGNVDDGVDGSIHDKDKPGSQEDNTSDSINKNNMDFSQGKRDPKEELDKGCDQDTSVESQNPKDQTSEMIKPSETTSQAAQIASGHLAEAALSLSKNVQNIPNQDSRTDTSSSLPASRDTSRVNSPAPQTPSSSSSGRRNRRKAAKPQKQVGGRYYANEYFMEDNSFMDDNLSGISMEVDESFTRPADRTPLDLTSDNRDAVSNESYSNTSAAHNSSKNNNNNSSNNDDDGGGNDDESLVSIHGGDKSIRVDRPDEDFTPKTSSSSRRQLQQNSGGSESGDSNAMLADFAKNTMTELLGIYGFDGAEARNLTLGKMPNFPNAKMDASSLYPGATDTSPTTRAQVQTGRSAKSAAKSGPFMKKVYTSLMTPKSTNDVTKPGFHLHVPSLPLPVGTAAAVASPSPGSNGQPKERKMVSGGLSQTVPRKNYTTKALNSADFHKYIRRYGNGMDCGGEHCKDLGYRDHYHCLDCPHKVFIRKEEMIRHFKWHKKRQESLQHGFMRYSPMDDCSKRFGSCAHNGRQTHYHCVQRGCDKVYISTSDVQMHANFHRKDSAIIQEGFQRFRATEDCGTTSCAFYGQRTTHFHCRRPQCNFTFKNKSDMEKHKSYHQKDQVLSKDGFKKFMKYEACPFVGCRYSKSSNHIHCIRPGCQYVLHSTAQLYSHKRKHERREFENAYRSYRQLQQQTPSTAAAGTCASADKGVQAKSKSAASKQSKSSGAIGGMTFVPLPATNTSVTNQDVTAAQIPPGMLALQNVPLDGNILTSLSANAQGAQKSYVSARKGSAETASALNLTRQNNVFNLNKSREKEEERQTMALPVRLLQEGIKTEFSSDNGDDSCEAEDLSMNKKRKAEDTEDDSEISPKVVIKEEEMDPSSDDNRNPDEPMSGIEDEDEDNDDDEDDDDKDYGQVEEPTLVNNLDTSSDCEKPTGVLNLLTSVIKKEIPETMVSGSPLKLELGSSDSKQEVKPSFAEAMVSPLSSTSPAKMLLTGLPLPLKTTGEKKEKDESWKKYLIRYTANDACFSRCVCLYKDHYHCRVEGCQVIFKSKDGVRGHARFHENQDSITPLVYRKFDALTPCKFPNCSYTEKELHYHCNWANCKQVIPHSGPTFALLEHYRIHEFGISAMNKTIKNVTSVPSSSSGSKELDPLQKRRGRPPKYPRDDLPVVPKVYLTEKEILDSTLAFMHKKYNEDSRIINGFKKILSSEKCPDDNCIFQNKDHYHCGRKYCHMSTDRLDFLTLHAKDFHNNVTILEGYEFFERNVNCRRPHCSNNRINRHYHCMRPRCDYTFVRHSTMVQHNKKHPTAPAAVLTPPGSTLPSSQSHSFSNKKSVQQFVTIAPALVASPSPPASVSTPTSATSSNMAVSAMTSSKSNPLASEVVDGNGSKTGNAGVGGKTVVKSAGTFFPLSGLPKIQLASVPGLPVEAMASTAGMATMPGQSIICTSISGGTTSTMTSSIPDTNIPVMSASPLTSVTSSQVIQGAQILQTQNGASVINAGGMCLTLPPNIASSSIPILTPTAQNPQQPTLLTGIIPVGNLATSQSLTPQLVNIPGAQIITTSQGSFLQHGSVLGSNLVQVIQNPITVISSGTADATSISASPGSTLAVTGPVAGTCAPVTLLLQQQQQQQQQGNGPFLPLTWANLKKKMHYPLTMTCGRPFCKLKKKDHYHCLDCYQAFSDPARLRVHLGKHGFKFKKPNPKLKGEDSQQDQIVTKVSEGLDLSSQVKKQSSKSPVEQHLSHSVRDMKSEDDSQGLSSSLNLCHSVFTEMVAKGKESQGLTSGTSPSKSAEKITLVMSNVNSQWTISGKKDLESDVKKEANLVKRQNKWLDKAEDDVSIVAVEHGQSSADNYDSDEPLLMVDEGHDESNDSSSLNASSSSLTLCSSLSRKSRQRRPSVRSKDYVDSETIGEAKPPKQRRKYRKDFSVPEGFIHVKCSEDCGYTRCAYRQSVTHFHCLRSNCGYGISDRSRIIQHRVRHERLDALMGGEFQHYRASVSCQRTDCEFDEKSSHFHCMKCIFSCADSGRVPAHRKHHAKLDNVSSNGFIKFTGVQDCQIASCYYFRKQTHYHCTFPGCNHSVLGPSQMAPHKLKHAQHSE